MRQSISSLMIKGRFPEVADIVGDRFGCSVDGGEIDAWTMKTNRKTRQRIIPGWSDCTWLMFFKNRIADRLPSAEFKPVEIRFSCPMHVFFIHIEENELMLARLRHDKEIIEQHEARSRLNKLTAEFIEPINRVAARVV